MGIYCLLLILVAMKIISGQWKDNVPNRPSRLADGRHRVFTRKGAGVYVGNCIWVLKNDIGRNNGLAFIVLGDDYPV